MTKKISLVLCAMLLVLWISLIAGLPGHSHAQPIMQPVNNFRGHYYQDAEKNFWRGDDDYMCWAASAANVLAWTGWADYDEDYVFNFFNDHDPLNEGAMAIDAWDFWLYGQQNRGHFAGSSWTGYDMSGYAYQEMYRYEIGNGPDVYAELEYMIDHGYGVSAALVGVGAPKHAVTIWGYDKHPQTGDLTGIYITDSDTWHETWLLNAWPGYVPAPNSMEWIGLGLSSSDDEYHITTSNDIRYLFQQKMYLDAVYGLSTYYDPSPVPIPSAIWLLGSGLIGLVGFRRKFKKA